MNKSELARCKEDVVYFAEKYLGCELSQWQKTYIRLLHKNKNVYHKLFKYRRYYRL
ncbi:hypothetical protein AB0Y20_01085 [Heyndrickxia oleronia]